jgi:hypothetical protein
VQAVIDKITAQHDVEYLNALLAKETDENRRIVLLRLVAEAQKLRQVEEPEKKQ